MPRTPDDKLPNLAAALASPLRLAILTRLVDGPCLVGELVEATGAPQAVVSKQLGLLRGCGLLKCLPDGRCRNYSLSSPDLVRRLLALMLELAQDAALASQECRKSFAQGAAMGHEPSTPSDH